MSDKPLKQKGFTLIELLIVMLISGMIVAGVGTATFQLFRVNALTSDSVSASTQLQNTGSWISRDAMLAQAVTVDNDSETGELRSITLGWVDWGANTHQVVYTLEGSGELKRTYSYDDELGHHEQTIFVAQSINPDPDKTSCDWDGAVLTLNITAQVGEQTATRTYKVESRPLS